MEEILSRLSDKREAVDAIIKVLLLFLIVEYIGFTLVITNRIISYLFGYLKPLQNEHGWSKKRILKTWKPVETEKRSELNPAQDADPEELSLS